MSDKDILSFKDDDDEELVEEQNDKVENPEPAKPKIRTTSSVNRPGTGGKGRRRTLIDTANIEDETPAKSEKANTTKVDKPAKAADTPKVDDSILDFGDDVAPANSKQTADTESKPKYVRNPNIELEEDEAPASEQTYEVYNDVLIEDSYIKELQEKDEKKRKKFRTPAQKRRFRIILASAGAVFVGVLVLLNIRQSNLQNKDVNYRVVDLENYSPANKIADAIPLEGETDSAEPEEGQQTTIADSTGEETTETSTTTAEKPVALKIVRTDTHLNVGEYTVIEQKGLDIKLSEETGYEKVDTEYYFGVSNIITGYTAVNANIVNYNTDAETKKPIKVGSKESLESDGVTLVEIDVDVKYPEDYPTNMNKGYVAASNEPTIDIVGTFKAVEKTTEATTSDDTSEEEDTTEETTEPKDYTKCIVVGGNAYDINEAIRLYNKPSKIKASDGFKYKFILQLPIGAKPEDYELYVELDGKKIQVNTVEIKG